jgi:hypothetical protein
MVLHSAPNDTGALNQGLTPEGVRVYVFTALSLPTSDYRQLPQIAQISYQYDLPVLESRHQGRHLSPMLQIYPERFETFLR